MSFDELYGNARVKDYLRSSFERGSVPHAFLLSGPSGVGKRTLAALLARALVCHNATPPCGTCPACVKAKKGVHPDIIILDNAGVSIKVDEIRKIKQNAYVLPNDGAKKVYIIYHADDMTQEAQDALLKIVEEPPQFIVFILICINSSSMLETILSRVTHLVLAPLNNEEMRKLLHERNPELLNERLDELVEQSGGFAGNALTPHENRAETAYSIELIERIYQKNELSILEFMISIEKLKRDELIALLDEVMVLFRDALMILEGVENTRMRPSAHTQVALLTQSLSAGEILELCKIACEGRRYCTQNGGVAHITAMLACKFYQAIT